MRNEAQIELPSFVDGEVLGRVIEIREERVVRSITIREDDDCEGCPPVEARPIVRANRPARVDLVRVVNGGLVHRGMPRPRPGDGEVTP